MGRNIELTDGGKLVFQESIANGGGGTQYVATIQLAGNLTANRNILIDDADGILQGLVTGTGWPTTKGGTGLTSLANNVMIAGSGGATVKTIAAPTVGNSALFYDSSDSTIKWVILDLTGTEATSARNLSDTTPGVYASKLGSELRFRNIVGSGPITITQSATEVTVSVTPSALSVPAANVTGTVNLATQVAGTLPLANGGLGFNTVATREIPIGTATNVLGKIAAPTTAGQRLTYDGSAVSWNSTKDFIGGHLDFPIAQTYTIALACPYSATINNIKVKTGSGTLNYQLKVNSAVVGSGAASTTLATNTLSGVSVAVGQTIELALSNVASVSAFPFTIEITRT